MRVKVPLHDTLHVHGKVRTTLRTNVPVRIQQTIRPELSDELRAVVQLEGAVPARFEGELRSEVTLDAPIPVQVDRLSVRAEGIGLQTH